MSKGKRYSHPMQPHGDSKSTEMWSSSSELQAAAWNNTAIGNLPSKQARYLALFGKRTFAAVESAIAHSHLYTKPEL